MHNLSAIDRGRDLDWGKASEDYASFRSGPPQSFYEKLFVHGVGLQDQRILDLATGTALLAREFARRGSRVSGVDISLGQIEMADQLAKQENLNIALEVSQAESTPFADNSFDVATANQCWLYFDKAKVIPELKRVLTPKGLLVTSHFSWLPRLDKIAHETEKLILKHNPQWSAADWSGVIPAQPKWSQEVFNLRTMFYYDELISFTRQSWRGRIRASRAIGAALSKSEVEAFDEEHDQMLKKIAGDNFSILHRIDAHIFEFKERKAYSDI